MGKEFLNKVLLVALHGVEFDEIRNDFANKLFNGIRDQLNHSENEYLSQASYNWTNYTNPRQIEMFERVEKGLGRQWFRKYKHTLGSDISWCQRAKEGTPCFYNKFVNELGEMIDKNLDSKGLVVLFGHSQGSQLAYQFIFDYEKPIQAFFSAGSPISMNSGMYDDWGRLPKNLKSWTNYFNKYDGISSRLQDVHPSEQIANFVKDEEVPSGYNPLKWTLFGSHTIYWNSPFVYNSMANKIKLILNSREIYEQLQEPKKEKKEILRTHGGIEVGQAQSKTIIQKVPTNRIEK